MRGAVLFAFNTDETDYVKMAVYTAKRINRFLELPVTLITDASTDLSTYDYTFDKVEITESNTDNSRSNKLWLNKGRHKAYELSPYDETLVMDTDYQVNSRRMLKTFDIYENFMCHKSVNFFMLNNIEQEKLSAISIPSVWATTMTFNRSQYTEDVFNCMRMIEENYSHYSELHKMTLPYYRNDYALALALRIVNGHLDNPKDFMPWNLVHVAKNTVVYRESDTSYVVVYDNWKNNKIKKEFIVVKDMDFHMLNKTNFMELINE